MQLNVVISLRTLGFSCSHLRVFFGQGRQNIEDTASEPELILTESGNGYRFADSG